MLFCVIGQNKHSCDWLAALATKGGLHFQRPQGGCKGFIQTGAFYNLKAPYLASAAILYNSRGRSPQPACKASADHRQNPWRPGPKARRRHQPSPAKAGVNLREYWKAPPRSRSRPRHRPPNAAKGRAPMSPAFSPLRKNMQGF